LSAFNLFGLFIETKAIIPSPFSTGTFSIIITSLMVVGDGGGI